MSRDPRIDAYIARSADFAQPILGALREQVHKHCPDIQEGIKWSMPSFQYEGRILCSMAAFKQHCAFGFWLGDQVVDAADNKNAEAMGQLGRLTSLKDIPSAACMKVWIRKAMALTQQGAVPLARAADAKRKPAEQVETLHADFVAALSANRKAKVVFEAFPPGQRREYAEWIEEAKRDETRAKRIAQAIEWLAEGKTRHWKYR